MRELTTTNSKVTKVVALDEAGRGGAHHEYGFIKFGTLMGSDQEALFGKINFQEGPVKESGINGCHNEDVLAVVLDRLQSFQSGAYRCRENDIAITKIEEALLWLEKRTNDRINRGVEGTSII